MRIAVIGAGYVGLVTGACLAEAGNGVTVMDVNASKIESLKAGRLPIHEAGLEEMVRRNVDAGRLAFAIAMQQAVAGADIIFIAVGTPAGGDGGAVLRHVLAAAREIGLHLGGPAIVVNKSTAPVGTLEKVRDEVFSALGHRGERHAVGVVSNPEFLREGAAVADFMRPDRIVIGSDDPSAIDAMRRLYAPFIDKPEQLVICDAPSAELIKYAANAMLATRISFMNEIANFAEKVGADIGDVKRGLASDPRIGADFLNAGCGFGGSCFPKDVRALVRMARREGQELHVVRAVENANEAQKGVVFRKLRDFFEDKGGLKDRTIALWGLAFKPGTDDMREAPSLVLVGDLLNAGAKLRAYDPAALETARRALGTRDDIMFCASAMEALNGAHALAIVTEWAEFAAADLTRIGQALHDRFVVDGRNMFSPEAAAQAGLTYASIGRKLAVAPTARTRLRAVGAVGA